MKMIDEAEYARLKRIEAEAAVMRPVFEAAVACVGLDWQRPDIEQADRAAMDRLWQTVNDAERQTTERKLTR